MSMTKAVQFQGLKLAGEDAAAGAKEHKTMNPALARAVSLHLDGQLTAALKELREAIDGGNRQAPLYSAMGHILCELHEFQQAVDSYAKLLELEPEHRTAHFNNGVCLGRMNRWEDARSAFERSLRIDPGRTEAHLGLGTCLLHLERPAEAYKAFAHYLGSHPKHEEALFGSAVALQQMGQLNEARDIYLRVLAQNPGAQESLINLTEISLAEQDHEQVRKYSESLLALDPDS